MTTAHPMECPACGEIALEATSSGVDQAGREFTEYECSECPYVETGVKL